MARRILATALLLCGAGVAAAQQQVIELRAASPAPAMAAQGDQVRVNIAMNIFVPAPAGLGDQAMQAQERARRQMYELAAKECAVLREVIANDCRIESVNVNVSRQPGYPQIDGFAVSANINYRVTLK